MMPDFIQKHKYHLILFVILLLTASINGWYLLTTVPRTPSPSRLPPVQVEKIIRTENSETLKQQTSNISSSTTYQPQTKTTSATKQISVETNKPINQPSEQNNSTQNTVSTTFFVNNKQHNIKIPPDSTVYDAMRTLSEQTNFNFNGKNYGGLGFFVEEINGIKNDKKYNKYWIYYINGESAKVGVSSYKLKNNDLINWKYEESKF